MSNRGSLLRSISRNGGSNGGNSGLVPECVEFISTLLASPGFGAGCSTDRDLCDLLLDGEILCGIIAELSRNRQLPGDAFASSYYSLNSELLTKKNIQFFLKQCRESFGLEERDLFEPADLLALKCPERVVKTVHLLLTQAARRGEIPRPENQLVKVVQEICHSERLLLDKLVMLLLFRKELLGALSEWSEDLVYVVFRHTEQLYSVHKEFLAKLTNLFRQGCRHFCQQLGSAFAEICPKLEIYFQHFSHMPAASERLLAEFAKSPELRNQLGMLERIICATGSFRTLCDATYRQLFNYQLLFIRLSKTAAREAPEVQPSVENALSELKHLLDRVNIFKRQAEQTEATSSVLSAINGLPSEMSKPADVGLLLVDGSFSVRVTPTGSERKPETREACLCVLTTKRMLVAAKVPKQESHNYWFSLPITSGLQAKRRDAATLEVTLEFGAKVKLEDCERGQTSERLAAKLDEAKATCFPDGWNANGHVFEVGTFLAGTECTICRELLNGVVLQGYGCQRCSFRVHPDCLRLVPTACGVRVSVTRGSAGLQAASSCFHPGLDRIRAVALLQHRQVGSFLLRAKSGGENQQVMSIRIAHPTSPVIHIEVREINGRYSLGQNQNCTFRNMDELIKFYRLNDMSVHFADVKGKLTVGVEVTR